MTKQINCKHCHQLYQDHHFSWRHTDLNKTNHKQIFMKNKKKQFYPHPECLAHIQHLNAKKLPIHAGLTSPIYKSFAKKIPRGMPNIHIALSTLLGHLTQHQFIVGRGVAYDAKTAALKAKMEVIERICTYLPPRTTLTWGNCQELHAGLFERHQNIDHKRRWWITIHSHFYEAKSLPRYLPLEYSQLASQCLISHPLWSADSTGMAVHTNFKHAFINGLCEVFERLALQQYWSTKQATLVNPQTLPTKTMKLINIINQLGYQVTLINITQNLMISAYLVLITEQDYHERPALVYGASAHYHSNIAIEHALLEGYSQLIHALEIWPIKPMKINSYYDKFLHYLQADHAQQALNYLQPQKLPRIKYREKKLPLEHLLKQLKQQAFYVDRGNCLTDYLGITALQVFIPQQYPLTLNNTMNQGAIPYLF